ncbi:MAG: AAA family ATPase, partial [Gammaproteobacteria bacterium]|nr:AAA family ATPase [Gammaproteobacteria bacterium]
MYEHYYGFKAKPFDHSTEPDAFYLGESQKLALTSVHQGLQNGGGFIVITGLSGTGKSAFVEFLKKEQINSALNIASISAENLSDMELLPAILSSFACPVNDRSLPALIAQIENFIHDEIDHGKKPLLVVDEAQSLSHRSFEVLRLLSNFRSSGKPSFQVILVGDAGLNNILLDQKNATLKNQVVSYAEITPMQLSDTKNYVMHQLKRVGWHNDPILDDDVFSNAQKETSGIPAEINQYFDRLFEREMQKKSVKINPVNEDVSEAELGHFNQKELLAALNELESASQKNFEDFKAAKSSENIV